jgi:Fe2+-dicitrate sensor, membrane component
METDRQLIYKAIAHGITGSIEQEEQVQLNQWLEDAENKKFFDEITNTENLSVELKAYYEAAQRAKILNKRILRRYQKKRGIVASLHGWRKYAAAAGVIMMFAISYYIYNTNQSQTQVTQQHEPAPTNPVTPGIQRATLTMANGESIFIDSSVQGPLRQVHTTTITNYGNRLAYINDGGVEPAQMEYNRLTTAHGEMYSLVLSDGTRVWLNAGSSLQYPVAFNNKERRVTVSGEAYFEVAKRNGSPFRIKIADGREVEVLGTHFNINAYSNEPVIAATLLEGSIKVWNGKKQKILEPGQQANWLEDSIVVQQEVNTERVVAWKEGMFLFDGYDLHTIMRQIERWYNIKVTIDPDFPNDVYNGTLPRNSQLTDVLNALKFTSGVNYRINGRMLTVGF